MLIVLFAGLGYESLRAALVLALWPAACSAVDQLTRVNWFRGARVYLLLDLAASTTFGAQPRAFRSSLNYLAGLDRVAWLGGLP